MEGITSHREVVGTDAHCAVADEFEGIGEQLGFERGLFFLGFGEFEFFKEKAACFEGEECETLGAVGHEEAGETRHPAEHIGLATTRFDVALDTSAVADDQGCAAFDGKRWDGDIFGEFDREGGGCGGGGLACGFCGEREGGGGGGGGGGVSFFLVEAVGAVDVVFSAIAAFAVGAVVGVGCGVAARKSRLVMMAVREKKKSV